MTHHLKRALRRGAEEPAGRLWKGYIPPYQRPYAWDEDQARDLPGDLFNAMDNTGASGNIYFLGSIVLIKTPGLPQSKVIDGQQRLTTLTILLSVLRDLTTDDEKRMQRRGYVFQKGDGSLTPVGLLPEAGDNQTVLIFSRLDENGDRKISREERDSERAGPYRGLLDRADGDGVVAAAELRKELRLSDGK